MKNRWLLPEGISDLLPDAAQDLEGLRRALLDTYRRHGFELVLPPLVEYLDSLLIGSGGDLDLKTFKLVDQLSGQSLGVRADITPQVSRIDAHLLQQRDINRLCYAASVLRTRPSGQEGSREPIQIGAEVYGHAGIEADIEVIDLLLQSLALAELGPVRLDINHLGLASLLLAELEGVDEEAVLQLLQARDLPSLRELLAPWSQQPAAAALLALPECFGPAESAMARARTVLAPWPQATPHLDALDAVLGSLRLARHAGQVSLAIDLADVQGFRYHTGLGFAAYVEGHARAVGRGGRYDGIGAAFGRGRPATGFSLDLRELVELRRDRHTPPAIIVAPWSDDPALLAFIDTLRAQGETVLQLLPGQDAQRLAGVSADRMIGFIHGQWRLAGKES
ncbi:ATP phosphoribosyltransferase regulatory subunit [Lautropia mirabilis]|jgi:ATP phosphoribosyltransferase, regulatory subunit|uniref:ATP phosphoribosyltransferase regulatory subunit n=1 Tax=Lautropia mirabilis ATCC 51599 TaxID=887898 RepID=E7RVN6_9BURK|nr:ATP phosphoribosyltransferase regulatory subunit [Lautropia mirabilis]EFV95369.1 putative ATP phosphoribosyltransferase, regulatory subunit [Lautropia mirabilis ATCC 51599]VEH02398.1 ATP phosphoribosyltransferase regulatory subunit [Lautropia mirabilis]